MLYIGFVVLLAAVNFGSLREHLLHVDDANHFLDNIKTSENFWYLFAPPEEKGLGSGRPISEFVKWLPSVIWGNAPGVYHMVVVVLHTLASLSMALVCRKLGMNLELSWLSGVLFLVNVAHAATVGWISALDYPLALIFAFACVLCYLRFVDTRARSWLAGFHLAILVGLFAHITIVMLLPFCVYLSWRKGETLMAAARRLIPLGAICAAVAVVAVPKMTSVGTTTWSAIEGIFSKDVGSLIQELAGAFFWLLGRLATSAHWLNFPFHEQPAWEKVLGAVAALLLAWTIWKHVEHASRWSLWTFLFLAPFLPLALVHEGIARYLYFGSVGSCALTALALQKAALLVGARHQEVGRVTFVVGCVALLVSSYVGIKKTEAIGHYVSGRYYFSIKEMETALEQFRKAIDQGPDVIPLRASYLSLVFSTLISGGDYQTPLIEGLAVFPNDPHLNAVRGAVWSVDGDPAVRGQGRQILARLERYAATSGQIETYKHVMTVVLDYVGYRSLSEGELAGALDAYQSSLQLDPDRANSLEGKYATLMGLKRYREAADIALQLSRGSPFESRPLHQAALALRAAGDVVGATAICQRALVTLPTPSLYLLVADLHSLREEHELRFASLQRGVLAFPDQTEIRVRLLELLISARNWQRADETIREAAQRHPDPQLFYTAGNLFYAVGELKKAVHQYEKSIHLDPDDPRAHANLGTALRGLGDLSGAERAYLRALQLDPVNPILHHNLGGAYLDRGSESQALQSFSQAVDLGVDQVDAYLSLARLHREFDDPSSALKVYKQLLETSLPGTSAEVLAHLSREFSELGDPNSAQMAEAFARRLRPR